MCTFIINRFARVSSALCLAGLLIASNATYGQFVTNGDFESWGTVSGTPPTGTPSSWNQIGALSIQGDGLVAGSTYSAIIQGTTSSGLWQFLSDAPVDASLSMVLASPSLPNASARSLHLQVYQPGSGLGTSILNLRMINGTTGTLTLQAHNGSTWVNLALNAFDVSVFNAEGNGFDTLNAYNLTIDFHLSDATPTYSITYGLVGSSQTTITDLSSFSVTPTTGVALTSVLFNGGSSAANYAVDNVDVSAIPEPSASFMLIGVLALALVLRRRRIRR